MRMGTIKVLGFNGSMWQIAWIGGVLMRMQRGLPLLSCHDREPGVDCMTPALAYGDDIRGYDFGPGHPFRSDRYVNFMKLLLHSLAWPHFSPRWSQGASTRIQTEVAAGTISWGFQDGEA
jgi:hypothetical protein